MSAEQSPVAAVVPRAFALVTPGTACGAAELVAALLALGVLPIVAVSDEHRDRLVAEHDFDVVVRLDPDGGVPLGATPEVGSTGINHLPGTAAWALQLAVDASRGVSRRGTRQPVSFGPLRVDVLRHTVTCSGHDVTVSPLQFRLLRTLVEAAGAVVSRRELSTALFGCYLPGDAERLEAHIRRARRRLVGAPGAVDVIVTVRSEGWRIADTHALSS